MWTEITSNGIEFTYSLSYNGASYTLWPRKHHTKKDIKEAKQWLRQNHDVVSIRQATPEDWDDRYKSDIFADPRCKPLKWFQINTPDYLLRKERMAGTSPQEYVTKHVLPNIAQTERNWLNEHGVVIYSY